MSLPPPPTSDSPVRALPRCYRHADREAGRSCTRCGKPACGECLVQAAVGSHCLDCAKAARPDVKTRARYWNAGQATLVAYTLIGINIAVFAWVTISDPSSIGGRGGITKEQFDLGLNQVFFENGQSDWYRLVTSGFLHFGIMHIAFNMLLLYQLGQLLERALDRTRFGLLYFACLLGGSFGVLAMHSTGLTGGASGAVFGLMAAAAVGLHRRGVNVFSTGIGTTLLLNLFITFAIPGISIGGHLGGAATGAVLGYIMLPPSWKPLPRWVGYAAPCAAGVLAVVGCYIVTR